MSTSEPSPKKTRAATILVLFITFASGAVAGSAVVHALAAKRSEMRPPLPLDGLELTQAQREKADAILEKHRPQVDAIFNDTAPKVRAVIEQVDREIREILTPEQRAKFDQITAERKNRPLPGFGGPRHFTGRGPGGHFDGPPGPPIDGPLPPCMPASADTPPNAVPSSVSDPSGQQLGLPK